MKMIGKYLAVCTAALAVVGAFADEVAEEAPVVAPLPEVDAAVAAPAVQPETTPVAFESDESGLKLSLSAYADIESAYISRGIVWDKRPYSAQYIEGGADLWGCGTLSGYVWTMSATTDKGTSSDMTRYAYNEADYGIKYAYAFDLTEDVTLKSGVIRQWVTNPGFRGAHSVIDWQVFQSLENPIVTPYWKLRRLFRPYQACYWMVGVRKGFEICEDVTFTIDFFGDLGNSRHIRHLYGPKPSKPGSNYHGGLQALNLVFRLDWALTENLGLYAFVGQFCIVSDDIRDTIKASDAREACRDLTFGGVGVSLNF